MKLKATGTVSTLYKSGSGGRQLIANSVPITTYSLSTIYHLLSTKLRTAAEQYPSKASGIPVLFAVMLSRAKHLIIEILPHSLSLSVRMTANKRTISRSTSLRGLLTAQEHLKSRWGGTETCRLTVPILFLSRFFRVFFLPVRIEDKTKNQKTGYSNCKEGQKHRVIHFYSPFSKIVPMNKNKMNVGIPEKNINGLNFCATNGVTIAIAKIILLQSKMVLAKFSRCSLLSFIGLSIAKIKMFIKFVKNGFEPILCGLKRVRTVPILFVVMLSRAKHLIIEILPHSLSLSVRMTANKRIRSVPILSILLVTCFAALFAPDLALARKINVDAELRNLESRSYQRRTRALNRLSGVKDNPAVVAEIEKLYRTEEKEDIRSAAVIAIGSVGGDSAVASLKGIFLDANEELSLRLDALEGLSRQRESTEAFNVLLNATNDTDPIVRRVAVGLLWQNYYSSEKEKVSGVLQSLLQDEDEEVRNSAKQMIEFRAKE